MFLDVSWKVLVAVIVVFSLQQERLLGVWSVSLWWPNDVNTKESVLLFKSKEASSKTWAFV